MKKIYITGVSGIGKTSLAKELKNRGFCVFDIDSVPELCQWRNKDTGERVKHLNRSLKWLEAHEWVCDIEKLKNLINQQKEDLVIAVGITFNQDKYLDFFDKILFLQAKKETLLHRLDIRTEHDFGKSEAEQKYILDTYREFERNLLKRGAISIDAENAISTVADVVISKIL